MKKNAFLFCHPLVNLMYFLSVIGFSCFYIHPVCLGISLLCSFGWAWFLLGGARAGKSLGVLFPMIGVTMLMNPLFNHQGVTVLWYLPGGNPLTAESILYGLLAGMMVAGLILWFFCLREIIRDEKIAYLFGKAVPSLGLVFSMILRFVPRFLEQFRRVRRGRAGTSKTRAGAIRDAMNVFLGVTTWALENAVDTADSMKARGYGLPGRTFYHLVRFDRRDGISMAIILTLGGIVLTGGITGALEFRCFPQVSGSGVTLRTLPYFISFFLLCSYPLLLELWEVRRWNSIKSVD